MSRRVLSVVPDLFFAARIEATALAAGVAYEMAAPATALERARAVAPDVIVLDLHAPGALDAARALAADPATAAIERVGFYSHVDQALAQAARAAGVDRVLPRSAFTKHLAAILAGTSPARTETPEGGR